VILPPAEGFEEFVEMVEEHFRGGRNRTDEDEEAKIKAKPKPLKKPLNNIVSSKWRNICTIRNNNNKRAGNYII